MRVNMIGVYLVYDFARSLNYVRMGRFALIVICLCLFQNELAEFSPGRIRG